mmetsp:Transcript_29746/g.95659  ORF Transcript_29746/g.95659 Transcript_29746/m.95659 type:complete len:281 (+) Transcript_29746:763-1605(+)
MLSSEPSLLPTPPPAPSPPAGLGGISDPLHVGLVAALDGHRDDLRQVVGVVGHHVGGQLRDELPPRLDHEQQLAVRLHLALPEIHRLHPRDHVHACRQLALDQPRCDLHACLPVGNGHVACHVLAARTRRGHRHPSLLAHCRDPEPRPPCPPAREPDRRVDHARPHQQREDHLHSRCLASCPGSAAEMRMRSAQAKIAGAANLPRPPSKDPHLMEVLLWHKGMMSLVAGGGSGGVMFLLAMYNMGQFKKGRVAFEATWVNLGTHTPFPPSSPGGPWAGAV